MEQVNYNTKNANITIICSNILEFFVFTINKIYVKNRE